MTLRTYNWLKIILRLCEILLQQKLQFQAIYPVAEITEHVWNWKVGPRLLVSCKTWILADNFAVGSQFHFDQVNHHFCPCLSSSIVWK